VLIALFSTAGCMAHTSVSSIPAPNRDGEQFHRVLVNFPTTDIDWKTTTEDAFVEKDSIFLASYKLFFPGRSYTDEEISAIDKQYHIDALLVISLGETGISTVTMPSQTNTTCGAAANSTTVAAACSTSQSTGMTYHRPWATWTTKMWSMRTGQVVWVASANTGGNAYANWHTVMHSMVGSTISKLKDDSLIFAQQP
jgi:hypothetical protein